MGIIEFSYCIFNFYRFQIVTLIILLHILTVLLTVSQLITINIWFCCFINPTWRSSLDIAMHSLLMR